MRLPVLALYVAECGGPFRQYWIDECRAGASNFRGLDASTRQRHQPKNEKSDEWFHMIPLASLRLATAV